MSKRPTPLPKTSAFQRRAVLIGVPLLLVASACGGGPEPVPPQVAPQPGPPPQVAPQPAPQPELQVAPQPAPQVAPPPQVAPQPAPR